MSQFSDDENAHSGSSLNGDPLADHDEDVGDDPTEEKPRDTLAALNAKILESTIAHALDSSKGPRTAIPSLVHVGQLLGFDEHDVLTTMRRVIESADEPTLNPEELAAAAAEVISAVTLVEESLVIPRTDEDLTVHVVRLPRGKAKS